MDKNSEIIRTEIIRILNESGKIRGTDLARRVIEKVGNEKTVYREISQLVEAGEIEKRVYDRSHIEYELINLYESVNKQLKNIHSEITVVFDEIINFKKISTDRNFSFHERLRLIIHQIQIVQTIDGVMKLLSYYPSFRKDQMFSQIIRKISDCWEAIMDCIVHQPEENFLNEILANLNVSQISSNNVN
ncbi:MAG: hypothetical protein OEW49_04865 [Nitrosopumilus sp.]|nr:hypothetical protein [Nitrosopumilus sp.]